MAQAARSGLAKVGNRKELVNQLERMNTPPKRQAKSTKQRPNRGKSTGKVKTYILEAGKLIQKCQGERVSWKIDSGGFDDVKILRIYRNGLPGNICEFYLDKKDDRFLLLHTNESGRQANHMINAMVNEPCCAFDHAWFYTDMLQKWTRDRSGADGKYKIEHYGMFQKKPTKVNIEGGGARSIYDNVLKMKEVSGRTSQKSIEVQSGGEQGIGQFVKEQISNTGCFTIIRGKSVEDHLHVVDGCKDEYKDVVLRVEDNMLGVKKDGGSYGIKGNPFVIKFSKKISDLERFIDKVFNSKEPFKLWGAKWEISNGYYSVLGVDLHEGSSINFEVADDMMRVYLYEGSCGNTLLRMFTHLQLRYDTRIECEELKL